MRPDANPERRRHRRQSRGLSAALALAALACCTHAAAQEAAGDVPATGDVKAVVVTNSGPGRLDEGFVRAYLGTVAGRPLDRRTVTRDVRTLMKTGRFSDVQVHAEPLEQGWRLVYAVRPKLTLAAPVTFKGLERFRPSRAESWLGLKPGDAVDDQEVGNRVLKIIEGYRKALYPDARATWTLEVIDAQEGTARVEVAVEEGKPARIKRVRPVGNQAVPDRELRRALGRWSQWNPFRVFRRRRYDAEEMESIRLELLNVYLRQGYLDATVDAPRVVYGRSGRCTVEFDIHEGERYRWGAVDIEGVKLFPVPEVKALLSPLREGAPARLDTMEDAVQRVRDFYGSRGYLDTRVRAVTQADRETRRLHLKVDAREGRLTKIRNVYIYGNAYTRDKVIRRELLVAPGDTYDQVRVRLSQRRLQNLGFFGSVRTYDELTPLPDERDLIVDVEEKQTGQVMVGAGFSSIDNLVGFIEFSQGNFDLAGFPTRFRGGGQKLRLRSQFGSTRDTYELSFVEPWFMDRKLSLGFDLFYTEVDYDDYDLRRVGGAITIAKPLPGPNRVSLRYQLQGITIEDFADTNRYVFADDPAQDYFFATEQDTVESSLRVTLSHDTRDNAFVPRRGNWVSVFGELSGGPMGFDTDSYTLGMRSWHYLPLWFGHVLSFRTRYEVIEEYGDTGELNIGDRLFLGGGRTLRGFDYRDVGPKVLRFADTAQGPAVLEARPVGGRSLALAGAEYSVPLVRMIRLAGFFDTGNVWADPYELDLGDLASSAGVGLRFDVPGFPIRIDRAWVLEKDDPYTEEDPWVLWIGFDY